MQKPEPVKNHPNATLAAVTTPPVALVVNMIDRVPWVHFDKTQTILIAGWTIAFVLFVGRRGLHGCVDALWKGTRKDQTV